MGTEYHPDSWKMQFVFLHHQSTSLPTPVLFSSLVLYRVPATDLCGQMQALPLSMQPLSNLTVKLFKATQIDDIMGSDAQKSGCPSAGCL